MRVKKKADEGEGVEVDDDDEENEEGDCKGSRHPFAKGCFIKYCIENEQNRWMEHMAIQEFLFLSMSLSLSLSMSCTLLPDTAPSSAAFSLSFGPTEEDAETVVFCLDK